MCFADGDSRVTESLVVVEYLNAKYGSDSTSILPKDPLRLANVSQPYLLRSCTA